MTGDETGIYHFKSFELNVAERRLINGEAPVQLSPKTFDALAYLVANRGRLVTKEQLMKAVWPDSYVEESNLARAIHTLRKALGQDQNGSQFIETVPTKGYRFVAEVMVGAEPSPGDFGVGERLRPDADRQHERSKIKSAFVIGGLATLLLAATAFWGFDGFGRGVIGARPGSKGSRNGEAFRSFEQGRVVIQNRLRNHLAESLPHFERAVELDPEYADAYAARADVLVWKFWGSGVHDDIGRARADVRKALELDPASSYAYTVRCRIIGTYDWDFKTAEQDCRRAIELDPENADAHHELAMLLSPLGRDAEAMESIDTAIKLVPTSFHKRNRGIILFYAGRFEEAAEQLEQVKATDPSLDTALHWLVWSYLMADNLPQASESVDLWKTSSESPKEMRAPDQPPTPAIRRDILANILNEYLKSNKNFPFIGATYCQLGDRDKAFEYLELGIKTRKLWMIHIGPDRRFELCRDDPRFEEMLKRVGVN